MAGTLLKCSICPRQPVFSDISHLLTHVSSKGHLAHLHRLQVRSHQEASAGQELANYNLWYQSHGLGQLLSERMQQKNAKGSSRSRRGEVAPRRSRRTTTAPDTRGVPSLQPPRPGLRNHFNAPLLTGLPLGMNTIATWNDETIGMPGSDEESEFHSSPTRRPRPLRSLNSTNPNLKRSPSDLSESLYLFDDEDMEASKLKGLVWPGMDIFDAATEEMRRKRNQKKDGSLLKQMEQTSGLIEATETIYSPSGTMRKQRPITGNVDEDSPLKGETPIPKKRPTRTKRSALAETSGNVFRRQPSTRAYASRSRAPVEYGLTSSANGSYIQSTRYSPTPDEKAEFNLTFGYLTNNRRSVTVFRDDADPRTTIHEQSSSMITSIPTYDDHKYEGAGADIGNASINALRQTEPNTYGWQFTQNQYDQPTMGLGKENIDPAFQDALPSSAFHNNPLGWMISGNQNSQHNGDLHQGTWPTSYQSMSGGYAANPLNLAFQHLQNHVNDPFTDTARGTNGSDGIRAGLISPCETLSENEGSGLPPGFFKDERSR